MSNKQTLKIIILSLLFSSCTFMQKESDTWDKAFAAGARYQCVNGFYKTLDDIKDMSEKEYDDNYKRCESVYWAVYCYRRMDDHLCVRPYDLYKDVEL